MHVVGVLERFQSEVYRKGVLQEKEVKIAQKQQNTLLILQKCFLEFLNLQEFRNSTNKFQQQHAERTL